MNVLYCGDQNIEKGLKLSVLSLCRQVTEPLHIYVMTLSFCQNDTVIYPVRTEAVMTCEQWLKEQNPDSTIQLISMEKEFEAMLPVANLATRFTPCCMLRLYADLVKELPNRILYLDNDVLARKDCTSFYEQDMEGKELAGVLDYYGSWFFRKHIWKRDYINSGVLLLNLKEIRRTGLFEKCRKLCAEKKMFFPDQTSLNQLTSKKVLVPRRYNEQRKCKEDTVFQHFTTSFRLFPWFHTVHVKPWQTERVHEILHLYEYDELFAQYQQLEYRES